MVRWAASMASGLAVLLLGLSLARLRRRRPHRLRLPAWATTPGLDVTTTQFWLTSLGAGAASFLLVLALTGLPVVSAMPALVVTTLPKAYYARQRARRLEEVQRAWPDGLRDLVSSVHSGASLPSAIEDLARYGPHPLRHAFQGFSVYSRSLGVVAALEMIRSDLADPTSDRVIEVLILAYERGGGVVPQILSDLADATTRDLWTLEQIHTESLEQKINSRIVFVLPWVVLVAMTSRSGAFRNFYSSPPGILVATVGAVMSLVGVVVATRLGAQPDEPRVFATRAETR